MKMLHVLYSGLGGPANVFFSMVSADVNKECEYEVIFNGVEPVREEYIKRCKEYRIYWSYVRKKPGIDCRYLWKLFVRIYRSSAYVVFLHSSSAILPACLARFFSKKIKKVLVRETQANHLKTKGEWLRLSLALLFANNVVFLTEEYKNEIKRRLCWVYNSKKTCVVSNGVDLDVFKPMAKKDEAKIVVGMQSRLIGIKDHKTLLEAFALLKKEVPSKPLQLMIAGDGSCMGELRRLAQMLNIENDVVFTGMIGEPGLVAFLNGLDVYVHASLGETMSTAIMQAMACGKPIVASDVPGINNMIINDVNGILVPAKDPNRMYVVLKELVKDKKKIDRLSCAALRYAGSNFSNKKMFELYKQAIA